MSSCEQKECAVVWILPTHRSCLGLLAMCKLLPLQKTRNSVCSVFLPRSVSRHRQETFDSKGDTMNVRNLFSQTPVAEIAPEDAQAKQKAGAVIVDVREPYEWSEGSIPGAIHIPLGTLSRRLAELDASREMIMVCRSGSRSRSAVQILQRAGF